MAFKNLTKDEYYRLVSNRLVAIYAMIKDCEVRDDIIKIMSDSIDAHYPCDGKNSNENGALPIPDVIKCHTCLFRNYHKYSIPCSLCANHSRYKQV